VNLRAAVTSLAVVGLGVLLGASAYESVVMAPNYAARVPESLEHIRAFFLVATPRTFFRTVAPATEAILLLAVVLNWRTRSARWWMVAAFAALAAADVITFAFHYPRNALLFERPLDQVPLAQLRAAAAQWGPGNHVRVALLVIAIVSALRALTRPDANAAEEDRHA